MGDVVYLIGATGSGRVKIGWSNDVGRRFGEIQSMSPVPLEIRMTLDGDHELETALHRHFKGCRAHGEWFDLGEDATQRVADAVAAIQEQQAAVEDDRDPLERVRIVARQLDEALAARDAARLVLREKVATAARGGVKPGKLALLTGKSAETIRQWCRERGVEPLREPTSKSFRSTDLAEEADA